MRKTANNKIKRNLINGINKYSILKHKMYDHYVVNIYDIKKYSNKNYT